jgi:hypothetical protein
MTPFGITSCGALAADASGGVGLLGGGGTTFVRVDENGVVSNPVALVGGFSLAWTGSGFLVFGNGGGIVSIDGAGQTTKVTSPMVACAGGAVAPDGSVLAFGHDGYTISTQAKAYRLVPSQQGYAIDFAFGNKGNAELGPTGLDATAAASDGYGGFYVGVDSSVVHVGADGKMIASTPLPIQTIRALLILASGDVLALGDFEEQVGFARMTAALTPVATFGAFGFTAASVLSPKYSLGTVDDKSGHLYVSGWYALARLTIAP